MDRIEDTKRLFVWTMEFATRHLLVPGRVENWVVMIDATGVNQLPDVWKAKEFGAVIGEILGKVYAGRLAWARILNFPNTWTFKAIRLAISAIIHTLGKGDKINFVVQGNEDAAVKQNMHPGQVERWAGGTCPNLDPKQTYPYRQFGHPEGIENNSPTECWLKYTDLHYHEGYLWANCLQPQTGWRENASKVPLTRASAKAVGVEPVCTKEEWMKKMGVVEKKDEPPVATDATVIVGTAVVIPTVGIGAEAGSGRFHAPYAEMVSS
jgi:hypothetical protein